MADNNPNKRKCTEGTDEWRTTRGTTRGDTLVEIARNWFTQHYLIEQHLNGVLLEENRALRARTSTLVEQLARANRSNARFRTSTTLLNNTLDRANQTIEFQRRLLVEIFENHADVRAIYEADLETEEETIPDTDSDIEFPRI